MNSRVIGLTLRSSAPVCWLPGTFDTLRDSTCAKKPHELRVSRSPFLGKVVIIRGVLLEPFIR